MKIRNLYCLLMLFALYVLPSSLVSSVFDNGQATRQVCGGFCPTTISCPIPISSTGCATFACLNVIQSATFGTLSTACETISGNLTVGNDLAVAGDVLVENNLTVFEDECIGGNLQVGQNATIGGNERIAGNLTVVSGAFLMGPLVLNGPETINGSLTVTNNATINQNLSVGGTAIINGLLNANGGLLVLGGETIASGGLVILSGGASINGDVTISGNQTVDDLDVLGNLTVDELATFNGCNTTVNGPLITNGAVTMNKGLTIASGNETISTGNLTLSVGNLTIGGSSLFNGPVVANNGATINNGLTVLGGQTIATGDLTIATCGNMTIGGSLVVSGSITSPSAATLDSLLLTGLVNSTSPTTGTLVVNGGVGIAQDLWLGGSEFFSNVTTQGGTPSPFNYYEETCVPMTFRFDAGTPTQVSIQVVRVGALVNLLIPSMVLDQGVGVGVVQTVPSWELPARFRPGCTVRGASSTIVHGGIGELGEFEVSSAGVITFGVPGPVLGPNAFSSATPVMVDINTITYNVLGCIECPLA